ncbi:M56 family metallopeptidase [Clostridium grantii]|uniref:Bla regulator protein blaR1 n=1 Tax=Clostridium grantii DSM 8605 TaxID=1121316 RepID=A0A1M5TMG5_9CLOT|nr:M56 family metallopeptidase [Clostridium grantii]SHH51904.1 bla regulator protein blaR1 [Clostridium grantii DSM 8605]
MELVTLFKMILSLSFMGSILAVIIIIVKGFFRNRLNANWHYYIWILVIIKLSIPYAPESSVSIYNLFPSVTERMAINENSVNNIDTNISSLAQSDSKSIYKDNGIDINNNAENKPYNSEIVTALIKNINEIHYEIISIIWLIGTSVVFLYMVIVNLIFILKLNKSLRCKENDTLRIFYKCKSEMNVNIDIPVIYEESLKTPSLFGFMRPKLLMSSDIINSLAEQEKRYVFLHELAHLKRKDILVNWIMILIQAVHWFNPIIWYAFYKIHEDCEVACDAYVLSRLEPEEHKSYGITIIRLMDTISRPYWNSVSTGMANNRLNVKKRIKKITTYRKKSWKWSVIATILVIGIVLTTMTKGYENNFIKDNSPKVNIVAEMSNLTEEEYRELGISGLENPSIDDFGKFILRVNITDAKKVTSKKLQVPKLMDFREILDKTDERYWVSHSSYQNNEDEEFSLSEQEIVIYIKGIKETELKEMMKPLKIEVAWITKEGENVEKEYSIGEILTFQGREIN